MRAVIVSALLVAFTTACGVGVPPKTHPPDVRPTPDVTYAALGSGHLLRAVAGNGRYVTLEDGSRWEIHPRDRFRTIDWEADSGISVRTTRGEDGYAYEIVNTTDDDGALARLISR